MEEVNYNPNAVKKLAETMGQGLRERAPCGVTVKTTPNDKAYAKSALERMREGLKK